MALNETQLQLIRAEMEAQAAELPGLSPERAERRCRVMAILLAQANLPEAAEAARHCALVKNADLRAMAELTQKIQERR